MFWVLLIAGALDGIAGFAVPILLAEFTRGDAQPRDLVQQVIPVVALCFIATIALQWSLRQWGESLQGWLANALRVRLFRDAEQLSIETLSQHHSGYLASLINQVATSVGGLATTILWLCGHLISTLILFVYFTAKESLPLACLNLILLALFVAISLLLARRMVPLADRLNQTSAQAAERFIDFLANLSTVKRLGIAEWAERMICQTFDNSNKAIFCLQRFHALRWALLHAIFFVSLLATIAVILTRIESGLLSPSILILFIAGFSTIRGHAERLSELIKSLLETDAYVTRLDTLLSEKGRRETHELPPLDILEMRDVVFTHTGSTHEIRVPHFSIRCGERLLITGASGQGKSTLLSILAYLRIPVKGTCLWNGVSYHRYGSSVTRAFALASQEAELFNLSLRDNLRMDGATTDDEICTLLSELGLADLLRSLPAGLDTPVGEKGLRLSAGQKQRIGIARAVLLKRPLLVLDEPTSHLDVDSEVAVLHLLEKLSPQTTIIIASHEPIFCAFCSREGRFEGGKLLHDDNH
jgi:ABC-type bacteriocin/lantibiotic exporter with double-glycine peptidase domain